MRKLSKTLLSTVFLTALASVAQADNFTDTGSNKTSILTIDDGAHHQYENITIAHTPQITNSQFSILLKNGTDLTASAETSIRINATEFDKNSYGQGNYAIAAYAGSDIKLQGDVNIFPKLG